MLACIHKKKLNRNVYIPGIIPVSLCPTMPLIIPSGLSTEDPNATVLNSVEKAYNDNSDFRKKFDWLLMMMIYEHQKREHINLMSVIESIPE